MDELKNAIIAVMTEEALKKVSPITKIDTVAIELNEDYTIKKSLRQGLAEFAATLGEKANSIEVRQEIREACQNLYNQIIGKVNDDTTIDEAYDTLKEIADWIGTHGSAAATMTNEISTLRTNIENLAQQIAAKKSTTVEASETNGNIKVDGTEVPVYRNPGKNIFVASTTAEATAAEGKMENGDLLFQIVS